jgi:hypothetical protein
MLSAIDFTSFGSDTSAVLSFVAKRDLYGLLDDPVRFLEGWIKDTLPTVRERTWSVIRLDGDMYESTMDGLTNLYP